MSSMMNSSNECIGKICVLQNLAVGNIISTWLHNLLQDCNMHVYNYTW